jgi:PhnB protein
VAVVAGTPPGLAWIASVVASPPSRPELDFDETTLVLAKEFPGHSIKGPQAIGGTWVSIHFHVDKADEVTRRAVSAGAEVEREPKDEHSG